MTTHERYAPGDLVSTEPVVVGFDVIGLLGQLRHEARVIMTAIPAEGLTTRVAADFAARCDQVARAVIRLERDQHKPDVIDEQLRDAATQAQAAAVDAPRPVVRDGGYFSNSGAGSPPAVGEHLTGDQR